MRRWTAGKAGLLGVWVLALGLVPGRSAPLLASPLSQPAPSQGGGTRPPASDLQKGARTSALRPEPPWLPVHPERLPQLAGKTIYAVCFDGPPPVALATPPLDLPAGDPLRRTGGVVIAHCRIDPEGWVVEAQLLKGPDTPTVRAALVRTLARWRFGPIRRRNGEPAAVHYAVTLRVERER